MPEDLNIWTPLKPVKFLRSFVLASFITDIKLSQTTSQEQTSNTSMVTKQTLKSLHVICYMCNLCKLKWIVYLNGAHIELDMKPND